MRQQIYIRLPGSNPNGRTIIIGSHLDSVPMGGNFRWRGRRAGRACGYRRLEEGGVSSCRRPDREGYLRGREQLVPIFLYRLEICARPASGGRPTSGAPIPGERFDAAVFAAAGVPTIMVFVRNEHGSHNPDEAMDMADFAGVIRLLANGSTLIS
jgi:acetylornithine deacetylase/succinyl-diaminopimelate desuccinylase-like protein